MVKTVTGNQVSTDNADETSYTAFVREAQDKIRHALVAGFGVEIGREAAAEALVYAWERWDRVSRMENPAGYVFRVGHRIGQKLTRKGNRTILLPDPPSVTNPVEIEPALPRALSTLSPSQRMAVVLVDGFGFSQRAAADLLGIRRTSVQKHLERGMRRLRTELGVEQS